MSRSGRPRVRGRVSLDGLFVGDRADGGELCARPDVVEEERDLPGVGPPGRLAGDAFVEVRILRVVGPLGFEVRDIVGVGSAVQYSAPVPRSGWTTVTSQIAGARWSISSAFIEARCVPASG